MNAEHEISLLEIRDYTEKIERYGGMGVLATPSFNFETKRFLGELNQCSFVMFSRIKLRVKTYTVLSANWLKECRIEEDDDGLPENIRFRIEQLFSDHPEVFYDIASDYIRHFCIDNSPYFKQKNSSKHRTVNHLFCFKIFSKHTRREEFLHVVNRDGDFVVMVEDNSSPKLLDYIETYFSLPDNNEVEKLQNTIANTEKSHLDVQNALDSFCGKVTAMAQSNYSFQKGVITFLDFLGWKGLWLQEGDDNNLLTIVSNLIASFEKELERLTKEIFPASNDMRLSTLLSISDTIAIFTPALKSVDAYDILEMHAKLSKYIMEQSVQTQLPIRGAISYGEYSIKGNIMLGPGIDECASWHEKTDWMGVIFSPSAEFKINTKRTKKTEEYILEYGKEIPLKPRIPRVKYCVNWSVDDEKYMNLVDKAKALLPEIASKYLNTYHFLENAKKKGGVS